MILRHYVIMLLAAGIMSTCMFVGCKKRQGQPSSHPDDSSQTTVAQLDSTFESAPKGDLIAPNVLFSGPGQYHSSNKHFSVEIKLDSPGYVTYQLKYHLEDNLTSGTAGHGPSYPLSEKDLLMCWDEWGQLWTYHPIEFIHRHHSGDATLSSSFVGSGSKVRDQMPIAFINNLPKNIEEIYRKAIAESPNGALTIPLKLESSSEQAD